MIARIQAEQILIISGLTPLVDDRRNVGVSADTFTQAEKVAAVPGFKEFELTASTSAVVPLKVRASPLWPAVVQAAPDKVPVFPLPLASAVVVAATSLKP